jgi:riboflavin kinase / FMN adenylyltransferase
LVGDERGPLSSTRARAAIQRGDWDEIERVLGRPHALSGNVVRGDGRGRGLGFPTANLGGIPEILPPPGVYAVLVDRVDGGAARALGPGVASIGTRPTFSAGLAVEAHCFDFDGDLYGARLRVHLVAVLRPEKHFATGDALIVQMQDDARRAREILAKMVPDPSGAFF